MGKSAKYVALDIQKEWVTVAVARKGQKPTSGQLQKLVSSDAAMLSWRSPSSRSLRVNRQLKGLEVWL